LVAEGESDFVVLWDRLGGSNILLFYDHVVFTGCNYKNEANHPNYTNFSQAFLRNIKGHTSYSICE
jgi:hypothetical protein